MDENKDQVEVPDAGEFDLGAWISGHHTYPEYTCEVLLDKAAVVASNRLVDEIESLQKEDARLAEERKSFSSGSSLTDVPPSLERVSEIQKEIAAKRKEREAILAKAKGSALKVVTRRPAVTDENTNVFDAVRKELSAAYPDHADVLNSMDQEATRELFQKSPELAHEQTVILFHSMVASITNAKGETVERGPKLTREVLGALIKRLDVSDLNRLQLNVNLAMSGAELREEQIDAGFLG